jgi:hypothetical protein
MTGFSLQPIESVEMTHLAQTFSYKGEIHTTLNTHYPPYIICCSEGCVISTLSEAYAPKPVIPASLLRHSLRHAHGLEGRQSGRIGKAAVPFGPIRMWGSAAHDPSSVRGLN